jgi:DNA sulfur modification protein DndB
MASTFPAIRAFMGEGEFYCSVLTYGEAARLIQFVEDVDDWSTDTDPEAKIQRRLNVPRVEREMVPYLLNVPDHFYSALTVEIRPAITDTFDGHLPFEAIGPSITGGMAWGQLTLDGTETLYALDGQHRLKSIQLAIRQRPELAREQIPVIFVPHRSPRRSQLLFSDLNRFAKSPSKSISLLFSHRDPVVTLAKVLMDRVGFLAGRVEVETTSLSKHTPNVVTLSSLYEMTRSLTEGRTVGDPLAQEEVDRQIEIWEGLVRHVEPWRKVAAREEHPAYLRKEYLAMHGVCHQAIAGAIAPLLTNGANIDATLKPLGNVDWRISNQEWQGIAVQGRHISNTSTTVRNLAGMLSFKVGGQVEAGVAQSLVAIIRGRGAKPPADLVAIAQGNT